MRPCMAQEAVDSPGCTLALNTIAWRLRPGGSLTGDVIVRTSHRLPASVRQRIFRFTNFRFANLTFVPVYCFK